MSGKCKYDVSNSARAIICREGKLVELTKDSTELRLAGDAALDYYVARAVAVDPNVTYGCINYDNNDRMLHRARSLRTSIYHKEYPVFVGQRGNQLYIVKAVDFDG